MVYTSQEVKKTEYFVTFENGRKKLVLLLEDGNYAEFDQGLVDVNANPRELDMAEITNDEVTNGTGNFKDCPGLRVTCSDMDGITPVKFTLDVWAFSSSVTTEQPVLYEVYNVDTGLVVHGFSGFLPIISSNYYVSVLGADLTRIIPAAGDTTYGFRFARFSSGVITLNADVAWPARLRALTVNAS
jgi:hypothetical protein